MTLVFWIPTCAGMTGVVPFLPLSEGEYKGVHAKRYVSSKPPLIPPWASRGRVLCEEPLWIPACAGMTGVVPFLPLSEGEYKGVPAKRYVSSKPPSIPPWASRGRAMHSTPMGIEGEGCVKNRS